MAELLGFARPQENSYGCIAAVDYLLEVYSAVQDALHQPGPLCSRPGLLDRHLR